MLKEQSQNLERGAKAIAGDDDSGGSGARARSITPRAELACRWCGQEAARVTTEPPRLVKRGWRPLTCVVASSGAWAYCRVTTEVRATLNDLDDEPK